MAREKKKQLAILDDDLGVTETKDNAEKKRSISWKRSWIISGLRSVEGLSFILRFNIQFTYFCYI